MTSDGSASNVRPQFWALQRIKNQVTLGTWEDCAFHVSLRSKDKPEDPLEVPLFSDSLPYHCLPHCGVYGVDEYSIALPLVIITLPGEEISHGAHLFSVMPPEVQSILDQMSRCDQNLMSVAVIIHALPASLESCQREMNILYHMWALQDWPSCQEPHASVEMGIFGAEGVSETAQDICEELNGIPFGRLGPRILYLHGQRLSPHNAQLKLNDNASLHTFFAVAQENRGGRTAVTYHAVPSTPECEKSLKQVVASSQTIGDLVTQLDSLAPPLSRMIAKLVKALDK